MESVGMRAAARDRSGESRRRMAQWRVDLVGLAFVAPFLLAYGAFILWPIVRGFYLSFYSWSLLGTSHFIGLDNYHNLVNDNLFWTDVWHTIEFTLLSTPPLVFLGFVMALLANRKLPMQWLFRLAFFSPYILPVSIVYLVWNWLYSSDYGLFNSWLGHVGLGPVDWLTDANQAMISVVIVTVWWTVGFNFVLYLAGLQDISEDLYEAAALDGAGTWASLFHITIPLLGRTTTLIVILQVLSSLKIFDQIYLLTGGGPEGATRPVLEYIYEQGFVSYRLGYAAAMSYVFFLFILVVSGLQFYLFSRGRAGD
jgi:multiple sugar transport system permease protein